jgi:hypothetical protein
VFESANGFPNNYFGWGGEDDELRRRFETLLGTLEDKIQLVGKPDGLTDLEGIMSAKDKQAILHQSDKNPVRWEGAEHHPRDWKTNGLNRDKFYKIISENEEEINGITFKTTLVQLIYDEIKPYVIDKQLEEQKKQMGGDPKSVLSKEAAVAPSHDDHHKKATPTHEELPSNPPHDDHSHKKTTNVIQNMVEPVIVYEKE